MSILDQIKTNNTNIDFKNVIAFIDEHYDFEPTSFKNGDLFNEAGQNSGSCKLFTWAKLESLTQEQTLACFGAYYTVDVLANPDGGDHQNIRNFIKTGWSGIEFTSIALKPKV
jgi:hypothetical protein